MPTQARELIESLPDVFLPDKAGNIKALVQFNLAGDGGGEWALDVADGKCEVKEETAPQPDVSLTMDASDFVALVNGQLNPVQAFMGGKIKVTGNVGLVMQLLNWFKL
jgi:putative sterol carrier protein